MILLHYDITTGCYKATIQLPRTGDSKPEAELFIKIEEEPFPHSEIALRNRLRVEVSAFVSSRNELTIYPVP